MKLLIFAGPPSAGKTAVIRQVIRHFYGELRIAFLKIDVVRAFEDKELAAEFGIPARKVYSGDLCPDHTGIMVLRDAITWAEDIGAGMLIVESAGLCLRCTPYTTQSLGVVTLSAVSGTNSPLKMAPMIALADIAVVTKTDLISQAEKEVFRQRVREVAPSVDIIETNAIQGTGLRYLMQAIRDSPSIEDPDTIILRGTPPLGVCTICVGKKEIGWQHHFGVVQTLDGADDLYRGD
jgi:Ni2+-binding GTPase involved in maturation of urease and hydrogenase